MASSMVYMNMCVDLFLDWASLWNNSLEYFQFFGDKFLSKNQFLAEVVQKIQPFSASSSGHIHSFQLVMPAIVPNFLFLSFKELSVI